MYLSRLILNPRHRRVQKEIAAPYQLHRSIMNAFPDDLKEGQERVLFRLENAPSFDPLGTPRQQGLVLLVQSFTFPDWSWLEAPNARGYLLPVDVPNPSTKTFELQLFPGQTLTFRLRANPTVKRTVDDKKKRVGLYREEEQRKWLERKAEQGGFQVLSARTGRQDIIRGQLKRNGKTHKLRLLSVQFDGVLRVNDPERLRESVRCGIGSGKGMGFGLLSLAPPR
jgi:CRISPR system Cascade subunit CasE